MELLPFLYLVGLAILADVTGSFRRCGGMGAFFIMLFLTPLAIIIVYMFPRLPKAYCVADYMSFHTGVAYRYKTFKEGNTTRYIVVNEVDVALSEYEFTEYFVIVESRKQYNNRRKTQGLPPI